MDIDLTLAAILTAGGVVATAGIVTGLISMVKKLPGIGPWIQADREPALAFLLSFGFVVWSFASQPVTQTPVDAFGAFLAWYGIARLSGGIHDQVKALTT